MKENRNNEFIRRAVALSEASIGRGGGPFGAVVVKEGKVVGEEANRVTLNHDPTAHAEVEAIRQVARQLATHDLSGCVIYTSCEPCPMCLGAIYWARLSKIYYANDREDAKNAGFDDSLIYREIPLDPAQRMIPSERLDDPEAIKVFEQWVRQEDKTPY